MEVVTFSSPWHFGQGPLSASISPFMIKGHKCLTRKEPLEAGALPRPRDHLWVCLIGTQV